ncbi:MAG: hypothetical protein IJP59_03825, partial [Muribaculaceae bacterium]|nr:hypothetical protein [Muribaculaceae bacterium]
GLRKHLNAKGEGITGSEIDNMEKAVNDLRAANEEVDRLRNELAPKVKHMNDVLAIVKTAYTTQKKKLKDCYPQEKWADYGIPDKR